MSRYAAMFDWCAARGEGAFGAFLMLGDPDVEQCHTYLDALIEGGADMVELGIPFSDPVADGSVIQAAAERALKAGVRTADCLAMLVEFRGRHPDIPIGILTYANIVAAQRIEGFCARLGRAGADSLLVADVPSLEAQPYAEATRAAGIDLVMIAAPNTGPAAIDRIARYSSGYTYCVARAGVTGATAEPAFNHDAVFEALRRAGAPPPVLGFGITTPDQVRSAIASGAAGVISGSAIVQLIGQHRPAEELAGFVSKMKGATGRT